MSLRNCKYFLLEFVPVFHIRFKHQINDNALILQRNTTTPKEIFMRKFCALLVSAVFVFCLVAAPAFSGGGKNQGDVGSGDVNQGEVGSGTSPGEDAQGNQVD